jgi:hypothetical protein
MVKKCFTLKIKLMKMFLKQYDKMKFDSTNEQFRWAKIIMALPLILITFISCQSNEENVVSKNFDSGTLFKAQSASEGIQLPNRQVCMVNNTFMNKDQIEVPIGNEKYYGCCPGCVKSLKEDTTYRYSLDSISNEKVDKAIAFIILKPGTKDEVLYFQSQTNASKYLEKKNQQSQSAQAQ